MHAKKKNPLSTRNQSQVITFITDCATNASPLDHRNGNEGKKKEKREKKKERLKKNLLP